jgi:hypothetical protein
MGDPAGAGAEGSGGVGDVVLEAVGLDCAGNLPPCPPADPIGWPQEWGGSADRGHEVGGWVGFELVERCGLARGEFGEGVTGLEERLEALAAEPLDRRGGQVGVVEDRGAAVDELAELGRGKDLDALELVVDVGWEQA